jgi:hypothetical protein
VGVGSRDGNKLRTSHTLEITDYRQTQTLGSLVTQHKQKVVLDLINSLCQALAEVFGYDNFLFFHIFGANLQLFFKLSYSFSVKKP